MSPFHRRRPGRGRATLPLCLAIVFAGLAGLLAEVWYLHHRRELSANVRGQEEAAARIAVAQQQMARGNWDEAVRLLELASATERAGAGGAAAQALLAQARQGQANVLLERARAVLAVGDVERGRRLLSEYLAHPHAAAPDEAIALQADLARALSGEEAARRLRELSDDDLRRFERKGELPLGVGPAAPAVRGLFAATCRRQLAQEKKARAAQVEARKARLRGSTAYRELQAFVKEVARIKEEETALAERQEKALEELFGQLNVTDAREQEAMRASFLGVGAQALAARVERKRVELKLAFRREAGLRPGEAEAFDRMVDEQLDGR